MRAVVGAQCRKEVYHWKEEHGDLCVKRLNFIDFMSRGSCNFNGRDTIEWTKGMLQIANGCRSQ